MGAPTRNISISVSDECLVVLADAICAFSKETRQFQNLGATIQYAVRNLPRDGLARCEIEDFLLTLPVSGSVAVCLEVGPDWHADYEALHFDLARLYGRPLPDGVVIPLDAHLAHRRGLW